VLRSARQLAAPGAVLLLNACAMASQPPPTGRAADLGPSKSKPQAQRVRITSALTHSQERATAQRGLRAREPVHAAATVVALGTGDVSVKTGNADHYDR
jgi:hypothetical protein